MPLLDAFLSRFRAQRVAPTETLGAPGTAIYGGYVEEREKARELATQEARYRTYSDILSNTSIVAAGVRYYTNLVGSATWTASPAEADTDMMYAELAEAALMMDGMTPWNRVIRRAAMYRFYGFSVQEWTMARRMDGWLGYSDIAPRAQSTIERWDVDSTGMVIGIIQESPQTHREIYLPRDKVMYIVDDSLSDSPEGLGLFRHLVSPAKRLSRYEDLEGFGFETDLRGIPITRAPLSEIQDQVDKGNVSETQKNAFLKPLQDFAEHHIRTPKLGLQLDSATYRNEDISGSPSTVKLWDVELLQGNSQAFAENAAAIERLNREMARILGVEQLLLGAHREGSFALARDKTNQFYLLVNSALQEIRASVEKDLLQTLWRLNGWPPEMMPELSVEAVEYRDVAQVAATLRDMATAGAILDPDDPVIAEVRELMGVSAPDEAAMQPVPDMEDDE